MTLHLSDHFTYRKLIRFTIPSIAMMIFTSIYGVVDGLFISNFVGKTAFAAINLIMPFIMVLGGVGSMLGMGGSALVSKTLGEGDAPRAHRYFTMIVQLMVIVGVLFSVIGIAFIRPVSYALGATEDMIADCVLYGTTVLIFNAALLMQYTFQSFLIVAERPTLGLIVTVLAGITNMALDAVFIAGFRWGVVGAALATGLSQCVGGFIPLVYFMLGKKGSPLRFAKTKFELRPILLACANGSSEMMTSISGSITGMLYNHQLIAYAGADGVAAYGVIMYAAWIFVAIFAGYSNGCSPIAGYHYGAGNSAELKSILRKSLVLVIATGTVLTVAGIALAPVLSGIFVGYDAALLEMTVHGLRICFLPFVIMGANIYISSFFTALNNGGVSAAISFMRSLVLPIAAIIVLPMLFGLDGIWLTMPVGEAIGFAVAIALLLANRKKYGY